MYRKKLINFRIVSFQIEIVSSVEHLYTRTFTAVGKFIKYNKYCIHETGYFM